jgi:hypothetical protein
MLCDYESNDIACFTVLPVACTIFRLPWSILVEQNAAQEHYTEKPVDDINLEELQSAIEGRIRCSDGINVEPFQW